MPPPNGWANSRCADLLTAGTGYRPLPSTHAHTDTLTHTHAERRRPAPLITFTRRTHNRRRLWPHPRLAPVQSHRKKKIVKKKKIKHRSFCIKRTDGGRLHKHPRACERACVRTRRAARSGSYCIFRRCRIPTVFVVFPQSGLARPAVQPGRTTDRRKIRRENPRNGRRSGRPDPPTRPPFFRPLTRAWGGVFLFRSTPRSTDRRPGEKRRGRGDKN